MPLLCKSNIMYYSRGHLLQQSVFKTRAKVCLTPEIVCTGRGSSQLHYAVLSFVSAIRKYSLSTSCNQRSLHPNEHQKYSTQEEEVLTYITQSMCFSDSQQQDTMEVTAFCIPLCEYYICLFSPFLVALQVTVHKIEMKG